MLRRKSISPVANETEAPTSGLTTVYQQVCAEILNRNGFQQQTSLAAVAGLGVLISQVKNIQENNLQLVYLGAAILLAILGLLNLESGRVIAVQGLERQVLEDHLLGEEHKHLGHERMYAANSLRPILSLAAVLSRYAPTLGSSIALLVVWLNCKHVNVGAADDLSVISLIILYILAILELFESIRPRWEFKAKDT